MAILGAGPAGSALARALATHWRVLLLERQDSAAPAQRIGESLPGAALGLLAALRLDAAFLREDHVQRGATCAVWDLVAPVWRDSIRDPAGPGWHLDRTRFDAFLLQAALAGGAAIARSASAVDIRRMPGQWQLAWRTPAGRHACRARIVVDATGRSSYLARRLGALRHATDKLVCLHAFLPAQAQDVDQCTRIVAAPYGWWYTVRLPQGGRVLALHVDSGDPVWRRFRDPDAFLDAARRADLLPAQRLAAATPLALHLRPAGGSILQPLAGTDWLAIGDAALAFDPIASQGLFHALASAHKAAQAIAGLLHGDAAAIRPYVQESDAVWQRYRQHAALTYAGPARYAHQPFWAARRRSHDTIAAPAHAAV